MKKMLPLVIVGMLILTGVGVVGVSIKEQQILEKTTTISFEKPILKEEGHYLVIEPTTGARILEEEGKPMIPVYRQTFCFSPEAKIHDIIGTFSSSTEEKIDGVIQPGPEPRIMSLQDTTLQPIITEDSEIYEQDTNFPGVWYDYTIRVGMNAQNKLSVYVMVDIYPLQYNPVKDTISYITDASITITYENPDSDPLPTTDTYDLLIIAPPTFESLLQKLIDHKESHGIATKLVTTEEIYDAYEGRDKPEQIKYCILNEKETSDISYVMLVGGLKSYLYAKDKDDTNQGSTAWHVPVRYTNIKQDVEIGTISDLYYTDLYKYNETSMELEFEDWDSNGNDIFAEGSQLIGRSDEMDLVPDIAYGRLAVRNKLELRTVINKIITYENSAPDDKSWFDTMIVIAGKTFNLWEGVPDGEVVCNTALDYMGSLVEPYTVYASQNGTGLPIPIPEDIITAMRDGAGYVNFQGHGNPVRWDTIRADGEYSNHDWCGGISIYDYPKYLNGKKLPVVIVGGCHNALFNVTLIKTLRSSKLGDDHWYWTHGSPAGRCFSWKLVAMPTGGAIASTGCTGYGIGGSTPVSRSAELESNFFYEIGQDGAETLGQAHSGAIAKYVNETTLRMTEIFCITVYELFGDPSLQLGGYA